MQENIIIIIIMIRLIGCTEVAALELDQSSQPEPLGSVIQFKL